MKKFFFLPLIFLLVTCASNEPVGVVGAWEFGSIVGFDRQVASPESTFLFNEDGSFEREALGRAIKGTWEFSGPADNRVITIVSEEGGTTQMKIISLTHETLIYEEDGPMKRQYSLNRIKKEEKPKKRVGKSRSI